METEKIKAPSYYWKDLPADVSRRAMELVHKRQYNTLSGGICDVLEKMHGVAYCVCGGLPTDLPVIYKPINYKLS